MSGGSDFWTPENVPMLVEYVAAGMPYAEIGKLLGCTKNAALGKAHRMGIQTGTPRGPGPTTLLQRLAALNVFPPNGHCVYPIGAPGHEGFHFCGAKTDDITKSYCPEHDKLCRPNAKSLANIAAWENDPVRHLKQAQVARQGGLAKMQAMRGTA